MVQMSSEFVFTLVYLLICLCLIFPPTEVRSAGLTLQNVLSAWLGSEDMQFIQYHIKRTTAAAWLHSLLPLGYYIGLGFACPKLNLFQISELSYGWLAYLGIAAAIHLLACALSCYWVTNKFGNHPIAWALHHQGNNSPWTDVAARINEEFRRIDKFTTGPPDLRVIVTDSWVIKTWAYGVNVAHQADCHLNLLRTEDHAISHESRTGVQYLAMQVISANTHIKAFEIRLLSSDYKDLRDKLTVPVVNARNVVIQQTLTDRFLEAFREQVHRNPLFVPAPGSPAPDNCIGCLQVRADIKLVKQCAEGQQGDCIQCFCRPMWCLECMCKWFASRQNQSQPESWMASKSPCPTCRSKFCMLDVCLIHPE
ncbi:E3 ubiquitin-protein ligase TM129-like [Acanthaster planci]|uniref:E3 ubiquitin-protein ligase TM129-like n=1 Tax=Acanthaster planci TaxID=133434 RepID=A0A8B7YJZ9_ACAPL|nr:E3 ubiquitin-protein ligase TM129-like [Acanthaster planci]XP_022091884.1 E3 ubiquitin-protein ligase TM129-like [Acanthaster planci]XP_022091885.1 E3 ubiquitin-protein ligase TM129-like [Acanthaster planci]XP_022091886.1 E3 ubiquitin-protein ligase TM129-like [Acanthaster planci]